MSQAWRSKLDDPDSTTGIRQSDKDRLAAATKLLSARSPIPDLIRKLTEKGSNIRRMGNNDAHKLVDVKELKEIVERSRGFNMADKEGMLGILGFVLSFPK
jgi:hypothetical protein